MRRQRNAKIVATLGPASSSPEMIRGLFEAGADVFRLNFSHGVREDHKKRYDLIRAIERESGRPIGVLADLQGPKLRLGTFSEGRVTLKTGGAFDIDLDGGPGDQQRVSLPHPEIFQALSPGVQLLLDDGKVRLEVQTCGPRQARTKILVGGALSVVKVSVLLAPFCRCPHSPRRTVSICPMRWSWALTGSRYPLFSVPRTSKLNSGLARPSACGPRPCSTARRCSGLSLAR
jgi:hypothetical protein